jgi:hypothetical protein
MILYLEDHMQSTRRLLGLLHTFNKVAGCNSTYEKQ